MSRGYSDGPLSGYRVSRSAPVFFVAFTVCFGLVWRFLPIHLDLLVGGYVALVGLVCGGLVVSGLRRILERATGHFVEVAKPDPPAVPERPRDLIEIEHDVLAALRHGHDVHVKLRPHLREIARERLVARGIDLDADAVGAELLGSLAPLVAASGFRPAELFGPGIPLAELDAMVRTLEEM